MKRILIIRPSSLGDIIQTFPALTDAAARFPEITFDWAVKKQFTDIPKLHPAVSEVINIKNCMKHLEHYDAIFELTGLMKNAFFSRIYKADKIFGFSFDCAREFLASIFYTKRICVKMNQLAVWRYRAFFAQALGYNTPQESIKYGFDFERFETWPAQKPYWVFLHGTTRVNKQWPETYWQELAKRVIKAGFEIKLLWGNSLEHERALRIASVSNPIWVAPGLLPITKLAGLLIGAHQVVGLDSGLTHFSTALGVKTLSLYGSTDPLKFNHQTAYLASQYPCAPCSLRTCKLKHQIPDSVPCFEELTPERVF
ncbi:MAG: glycosyltransferase family 9 protein [Myxococcaceae bacterium]